MYTAGMPKVSRRADAMPASPVRKLAPYAEAAVERGVEVLHLNIGQPDLPSPAEYWEAVVANAHGTLAYSHAAGIRPLREAMAAHYRSIGIDVEWSQVLVCTAGSEALSFAMGACCEPGDEVIVPEPLYANYLGFAAWGQVQVVPVPTCIEEGFSLPSAEEFARRVTPRTRAVLINNPNNPTGAVFSQEQLSGLAEVCRRHDLWLVSDEVYRDFNFTGEPVPSVLQLAGLEESAVMVDSVSKRFSLCGARIGFLVCRNAAFNDATLRMAQARLCPPTLEQHAVLAAVQATPPGYFADCREEYRRRRDTLVRRLSSMDGVLCPPIGGAFYATVRLPIDDSDRFCQWLLESFAHEGRTVMLAPASGFYATPGGGKDEVRIAYVLDSSRIEQAMDVLEAALAAYPGRLVAAG
jgi:aspartate aminotransferase